MLDLIAIGDIKLDTFVFIDEAQVNCELKDRDCWLCIRYGEKLIVKDFDTQIAGSAPNVAIGLRRLGLSTGVVSIVGNDPTADLAAHVLKKEKVQTTYIRKTKGEKSSFSIVILYRGERTMLTSHSPHHYRLRACPPTKWLFLSELGNHYEMFFKDVVRHVEKKKVKLGFNPGTEQIRAGAKKLKTILKRTEVLFVNLEEAHALLQEKNHLDTTRLIRMVWKMGPNIVVITDGPRGAFAFDGGNIYSIGSFPAHRLETTGAGDAFATGFLAARIQKKSIEEALRWGSVESASVIACVGPQPGLLRRTTILKRLRKDPKFQAREL